MPVKGKYSYSLQVEVTDKIYSFHFKHAWECWMWMNGLRRAAEVQKMIKRTLTGVVKHNIGMLYFYFNSNLDNDIFKVLGSMTAPLTAELENDEFINELKNISEELNYFFDAFYAYKPFVFMLFKFIAAHIHKAIKYAINSFWNKKSKNMNAGEIIAFMNAISIYERTLKSWAIEDSTLNGWVSPLLKTFIFKLFDNCQHILANILFDLRNNYTTENRKIVSRSTESLEGHLNFIFDHYNQVPAQEASELLIETCATIMAFFLLNTKNFLRCENFPLQIYIAILNNNLLKIIKNFQKKVHNATNSTMSLKEVKAKLNEELLINDITEIERLCFARIVSYLKSLVETKFDNNKDFLEIDIKKIIPDINAELEPIINQVDNRFYISDLYHEIFEQIVICYYKKFIDFAAKITPRNNDTLLNKIKADFHTIEDAVKISNPDKSSDISFKMKQLISFNQSEDLDQTIMCVMNMHMVYKDLIDSKNIDKLLQAKIFFPSTSIDYISSYVKSSLETYYKSQNSLNKLLLAFTVNPFACKFIRNLSNIIRKSCSSKKVKNHPSSSCRGKTRRIRNS